MMVSGLTAEMLSSQRSSLRGTGPAAGTDFDLSDSDQSAVSEPLVLEDEPGPVRKSKEGERLAAKDARRGRLSAAEC